jgi:hypothetical protein
MLGAPSATGSTPFSFDDNALWLSTEDPYNKNLCEIAGLILTRNQADSTHVFSITHKSDEKLGSSQDRCHQHGGKSPPAS